LITCLLSVVPSSLVYGAERVSAKSPTMSYFDRLALANWKLVMRVDRSSRFWKPTGMLLIGARPSEVMATFMDFDHQAGFMPKVKSSKIVRRRGRHELWVLVILTLPWPVANAWVAVKYDWVKTPDGAYHMKWIRHRGSMSRYWGTMSFLPWGNGATLAICSMQAVPDSVISRSRLNQGIVWGTGQLLHHLRAEVDRRRRSGGLKPFGG